MKIKHGIKAILLTDSFTKTLEQPTDGKNVLLIVKDTD